MIQNINTTKEAKDVFLATKSALLTIGKLKSENIDSLNLTGSYRYILQSVKIDIQLLSDDNGTTIQIEAFSDDAWDKGEKKAIEKLTHEIENNLNLIKDIPIKTSSSDNKAVESSNDGKISSSVNFQAKTYSFNTGVTISVNKKSVVAKDENGSTNIDSENIDNFSYQEVIEPRLTPFGLIARTFGLGVVLILLVGNEWEAMFFSSGLKDILFFWVSILLFLISVVAFFTWMMDELLEFHLYNKLMANVFSDKSYFVTIGNNSGNNIDFIALMDEHHKIQELENTLNLLKEHRTNAVSKVSNERNVSQSKSSNLDELQKLGELYKDGILTEDEFNIKKQELLK